MLKLITNARATKNISLDDDVLFTPIATSTSTNKIQSLYQKVPYLYRAIDLRAKGVQAIPLRLMKGNRDVSNSSIYSDFITPLASILYRIEATLCLYGVCYYTKDIEQGRLKPYWLNPASTKPYYENGKGLVRFDYYGSIESKYGTKHIKFVPDELLIFSTPSIISDNVYDGISSAMVALASSETLYNIDNFANNFFSNGAIRATILSVDGSPTQKHKEELRSWWSSMLSGISKAFNVAVLSNKVQPVIVGDGLADLKDSDLTERREKHIASAFGIPHSLLSADSANYATSQSDRLNFYNTTIIPELKFILDCYNEQFLNRFGLELECVPEKLEIYQEQELNKAQGIAVLIDKVITQNEAREMLGKQPLQDNNSTEVPKVEEKVEETSEEDNLKLFTEALANYKKGLNNDEH